MSLLRRLLLPVIALLLGAAPASAQYDHSFRLEPGKKVVTGEYPGKDSSRSNVNSDGTANRRTAEEMISHRSYPACCTITQELERLEDLVSQDAEEIFGSASVRLPDEVKTVPQTDIRYAGNIDKQSLMQEDWRKFDAKLLAKDTFFFDEEPADSRLPTRMFNWGAAIRQMIVMQAIQHATALAAQEKTRSGLKGRFFSDYWNSVKGLHGWDDGNRFFTNYVAHPMQGATSGFVFIQNHERAKRQKFGESKEYWVDRLKTFAWAAAWSTNWELGPVSQASIGNVGLNGGMAYVDLVITPVVGTAWTVAEEAIDRYIIRHREGKSLVSTILLRSFLNPMRSMANLLRIRTPWHRERDYPY